MQHLYPVTAFRTFVFVDRHRTCIARNTSFVKKIGRIPESGLAPTIETSPNQDELPQVIGIVVSYEKGLT